MTFTPTHTVGGGGAATWPEPDPTATDGPRLDPWLSVMVLEYKGDWAHIRCENGWEAWTDGRSLAQITATAPATGYQQPGTPAGPASGYVGGGTASGYQQPGQQPQAPASGYQQPGTASGYAQPGTSAPQQPASGYGPASAPPAGQFQGHGPPIRRPSGPFDGGASKLPPAVRQRVQLCAAIGGGVAAASGFLPWLTVPGLSIDAWDEGFTLMALLTNDSAGGPLVGLVLLVAALGLLALMDYAPGWLLATAGACAVVPAALLMGRVWFDDKYDGSSVGIGAFVALAGGAAVLYAAYVLLFPPRGRVG